MSKARCAEGKLSEELVTLIGYRGSGKTEVGWRLAKQLGWEFVDTDQQVRERVGRTIREVFETDGESAFRKIEAQVLDDALAGRRRVISAGGGVVLARRNRKAIRAAGACIWLTALPEVLLQRIANDEHSEAQRPPLTEQPGLAEIQQILQARLPVYEASADHVIDTSQRTVDEVVRDIQEYLGVEARMTEESQ